MTFRLSAFEYPSSIHRNATNLWSITARDDCRSMFHRGTAFDNCFEFDFVDNFFQTKAYNNFLHRNKPRLGRRNPHNVLAEITFIDKEDENNSRQSVEESDSHPGSRNVSNILYELESDQIDKILDVLKSKYQHQFGGLEATGYGQYVKGMSVPRFSPAGQKRFVQIFNTSDHWVCATNIFSKHSHDVYVYDSLYETLSETLIVQVTSILRADAEKDAITFHIRSFQQQKRTTRLCGFYALAAAVSILHNKDPTFELFDEESMNPTYQKLCMGVVETFPSITVDVDSPDVNVVIVNKLHCKCQKQSNDKMMQCNKCKNWYHMGTCVPVGTDRLTTNKMTWFGPCCSGDSADVVEIIDLN